MERPVLFSAPMVRAILAGRKTQTRRVVRPRRGEFVSLVDGALAVDPDGEGASGTPCLLRSLDPDAERNVFADEWGYAPCPYGVPGDRLWVREAWHACPHCGHDPEPKRGEVVAYRAGGDTRDDADDRPLRPKCAAHGWRPSIHMPRWSSRITLEVTAVRVERLQDITEEDAIAEGVEPVNGHPIRGALIGCGPSYREGFAQVWDRINGKRHPWASNPWVWVVSFRRAVA